MTSEPWRTNTVQRTLYSTQMGENLGWSSSSSVSVLSSKKRKLRTDEAEEGPRKKCCAENPKGCFTKEDPQTVAHNGATALPANPGNPSSSEHIYSARRAAFEAKYWENGLLRRGGYGTVYAGYRKEDNVPVAIKHIPQSGVGRTLVINDGKIKAVPLEVVLLQKVQSGAPGTSAAVTLLDWFDLEQELILVLEKPSPCMDLVDYLLATEVPMQEHEAKIMAKQLVDAFIDIHSRGVFHRDIKMDNVLVDFSTGVPRIRIIDFGCGTFLTDGIYTTQQGTPLCTSPEWFMMQSYRAEPATAWQLGVLLYSVLHGCLPFGDSTEIVSKDPCVSTSLSNNCQDFLIHCLAKNPEARPTLTSLKNHPWLWSSRTSRNKRRSSKNHSTASFKTNVAHQ